MPNYGPSPAEAITQPTVRHIHGGETVDYTPAANVAAGDVIVQGAFAAIALRDILAYEKGSLAIEGSFDFPKATGDGGLTVGALTYWDATNVVATSTASGNAYLGKVEIGTTTETTVRVQCETMANASGSIGFGGVPVAALAATGTVIGNAAAITTTGIVYVTGSNNAAGVQLPAAVAGKVVRVINSVATATMVVYPTASSQINAKGLNNAYNMGNAAVREFTCYNSVLWLASPETIN